MSIFSADRSVSSLISSQNFPAEIFTVSAAGAPIPPIPYNNTPYNYDVDFGVQFDLQLAQGFGTPGVGPQHTFQTIQLPTSSVSYTQVGPIVNFVAEATYNRTANLTIETNLVPLFLSPLPPGGVSPTTEEVRIRPLITLAPNINVTFTSNRCLPVPSRNFTPPLFRDVEILNSFNQNVLPPINGFALGARLLSDGDIAIVIIDNNTAQQVPISPGVLCRGLLVSDLSALTNNIVGDTVQIIVRGTYSL